jgi:hypothetical protein
MLDKTEKMINPFGKRMASKFMKCFHVGSKVKVRQKMP